ncbi:hypothetical protein ACH41H_06415 [Streptomyces sp. NPDC020800]|uniref:hypothetical protein n=1 Tax=Streptomyces sp. NPDC020800 TaxID=3365092 RepID=UPI003794FEE2
MSGLEEAVTATSAPAPDPAALRRTHADRARSAYERAAATCRHAGVGEDDAQLVPTSPVGRAAGALRLSAGSVAALAAGAPDPAADARCARNAAAAAALAAQVAAARDTGTGPGATAAVDSSAPASALRAALAASRAAAAAAGGTAPGRDASLNAAADEAERHAAAAARAAGWISRAPGA